MKTYVLGTYLKHFGEALMMSTHNIYFILLHKKAVSHIINSHVLTDKKPCINKTIHTLLMQGYATFNMIVPGPQICCRYEMCTART